MYLTGYALPVVGLLASAVLVATAAVLAAMLAAGLGWPEDASRLLIGLVSVAFVSGLAALITRLRRALIAPLQSWSGRHARLAGEKVARLGDASRMGLDIPPGLTIGPLALWLWPRLPRLRRRLLQRVRSWRMLALRASSPLEDHPAGPGTLQTRFIPCDPQVFRDTVSEVAASFGTARGVVLVQPALAPVHRLVASYDPSGLRPDLIRCEEPGEHLRLWPRSAGAAAAPPGWLADLQIAERQAGGPVLLEYAGEPARLVQIRALPWPRHAVLTRSAWLTVEARALPPGLQDEELLRQELRRCCGTDFGLRLIEGVPVFDWATQFRALVLNPRPLIWRLWRLPSPQQETRDRQRWAWAIAWRLRAEWLRRELRGLAAGGPESWAQALQAAENRLTDLSAPDSPAGRPSRARPDWRMQGDPLLPWRGLAFRQGLRMLETSIRHYRVLRTGLPAGDLRSGFAEAWQCESDESPPSPLPSAIRSEGPRVLVPGRARGPWRAVETGMTPPEDGLSRLLWAEEDSAELLAWLPGAAGLVTQRGTALGHVGLQARALGIPFVTGVPKPDTPMDTPLELVADLGSPAGTVLRPVGDGPS